MSTLVSVSLVCQDLSADIPPSGSSHLLTPELFIDSLKRLGKASGTASRSRHADPHLPNQASHLSAPSNEVSAIRSQAAKAKHIVHDHHHHHHAKEQHSVPSPNSYDQELQASQGLYDRRFTAPEIVSPSHNHSSGNGHVAHQSNHASSHQQRPQQSPQQYSSHQHSNSQPPPLLHPNANYDRSASPAPSSASNASKLKERKGLKGLFSSKK